MQHHSSTGCSVAKQCVLQLNRMHAQLSGVQHSSEGAVQLRRYSGAQKKDAVKLIRMQGSSEGPRVAQYGAVYSLTACSGPIEVLLAEQQSSDEENQETSAIISKCQNTGMLEKSQPGIGISSGSQMLQSGIGIQASWFSPVPLARDQSDIAQLW